MELQAHLLLLYTRTGRQQSLNLEFLMETEYLAESFLVSVCTEAIVKVSARWDASLIAT